MTHETILNRFILGSLLVGSWASATCRDIVHAEPAVGFAVVDTGQSGCYGDRGPIVCPREGRRFHGQDAQHSGLPMTYQDNGDGTVTDLNTGLMWQQTPGDKLSWDEALAQAETLDLAGHDDWRLPTIKELYSLMDFDGVTGHSARDSRPYLDTSVFDFEYGNAANRERFIDAQYWSSTAYRGTTMGGNHTVFGVNFADGRIKGYGSFDPRNRSPKRMFVRYVRGNPDYGINDLVDQGDGTVADRATGLIWQQGDSGVGMEWEGALRYCVGLELAGRDDWRLPDAKELQSIADYERSPSATDSAALDAIFDISVIADPIGEPTWPAFWSSTTHLDGPSPGQAAVYVAFGEAQGWMAMPPHSRSRRLLDVHGAGAQRSDPKSGDASAFPYGRGPQGDVIVIDNFARCVRK